MINNKEKGCLTILIIGLLLFLGNSFIKWFSETDFKREFYFTLLSQEEENKIIKAEKLLDSAFEDY